MDVRLIGQVGNWLFHTAAAVKEFGKDALTEAICCTGKDRFERSSAVFRSLCDWLPIKRGSRADCSDLANSRAKKSNWQSLSCIPSRADCMRLFKVPRRKDVTYPVIHVRGTDFFTAYGLDNITLGALHINACAEAMGFNVGECVIVTDDPAYVKSLNICPRQVVSGKAVDDFGILANAKYLAMSPSTFSWWAGFIGYHSKVVFPTGVGPWDGGVMKNDPISARSNAELCWGGECVLLNNYGREDVALVTICTGRYVELFKEFYDTFKMHAKGSVKLYAMTDNPDMVTRCSNGEAVPIPVKHSKWPGIVLGKYGFFLNATGMLAGHRAVMSVQVNSRFVKDVNFTDLVKDKLLFCHHPYNKQGSSYICGGVVGGPLDKFMGMAAWVDRYIKSEQSVGRVPKWHDETALNLYKDSQAAYYDVLPKEFTYAEERSDMKTDDSVVMFKDKNKFFGCGKPEYAS